MVNLDWCGEMRAEPRIRVRVRVSCAKSVFDRPILPQLSTFVLPHSMRFFPFSRNPHCPGYWKQETEDLPLVSFRLHGF